MSLAGKIDQYSGEINEELKRKTLLVLTFLIRCLTGSMIGLTFSLIGQEVFNYNSIALIFLLISVWGVFMRLSKQWTIVFLLIFDLFCILIAMLLRMYILIAPG
jgi:hypothetical protein